jgi:hypothetical protein
MIDPKTGIDFPMFQSQITDLFGEPTEAPFPESYLRTMDFREFASAFAHVVDFMGDPWNCRIFDNYVLDGPLRRALGFLVERGLAEELRTFNGGFNIRKMKGGSGYSTHSWGLAVDFNADSNDFGKKPTLSLEFVKCFAESGFEWGGLWTPDEYRDGMHFQLPWIRVRTGLLAPVPWQA